MKTYKSIQLQLSSEAVNTRFIAFRLDADIDDQLKAVAEDQGLTKSATVRALLKFGLSALNKSK